MGVLTRKTRADSITGRRLLPSDALWQYAPSRGADGRPVSDFMMLVPGFRRAPARTRTLYTEQLQRVFNDFEKQIVFADLNLRLGVLWVTVHPQPGLCREIAEAIQLRLPGTKLVGNHLTVSRSRASALVRGVRRLLGRS